MSKQNKVDKTADLDLKIVNDYCLLLLKASKSWLEHNLQRSGPTREHNLTFTKSFSDCGCTQTCELKTCFPYEVWAHCHFFFYNKCFMAWTRVITDTTYMMQFIQRLTLTHRPSISHLSLVCIWQIKRQRNIQQNHDIYAVNNIFRLWSNTYARRTAKVNVKHYMEKYSVSIARHN